MVEADTYHGHVEEQTTVQDALRIYHVISILYFKLSLSFLTIGQRKSLHHFRSCYEACKRKFIV